MGPGPKSKVLGVVEVVLNSKAEAGVYSYINKEECEERVEYRLADDEQAKAELIREADRVSLKALELRLKAQEEEAKKPRKLAIGQ